MGTQDNRITHVTLLQFPADSVLVPRLLALMDPEEETVLAAGGGGEEDGEEEITPALHRLTLAVKHAQATRLLTFCITLDTEVPLAMWAHGFEVLLRLVRHHSTQSEEESLEVANIRAQIVPMLQDICSLFNGFIDHFVGAVELILE